MRKQGRVYVRSDVHVGTCVRARAHVGVASISTNEECQYHKFRCTKRQAMHDANVRCKRRRCRRIDVASGRKRNKKKKKKETDRTDYMTRR